MRVVGIGIMMVVDWVNMYLVGVMVHWHVLNMVFNWVSIVMLFMVLNWVGIVMFFVVSGLCYNGSGVIVNVVAGCDSWCDVVLFIISVLGSVSRFVVLRWA